MCGRPTSVWHQEIVLGTNFGLETQAILTEMFRMFPQPLQTKPITVL
jgi:hypothetical protein